MFRDVAPFNFKNQSLYMKMLNEQEHNKIMLYMLVIISDVSFVLYNLNRSNHVMFFQLMDCVFLY